MRGQHNEHIGLAGAVPATPKECTNERNVPEKRHLGLHLGLGLTHEAANHDRLVVLDQHRGLRRALGGDEASRRDI